jgi:hypothetical protein
MDLFWVKDQTNSPAWIAGLTLKYGTDRLPEVSVTNYQSTLRNIQEEQRSHTGAEA